MSCACVTVPFPDARMNTQAREPGTFVRNFHAVLLFVRLLASRIPFGEAESWRAPMHSLHSSRALVREHSDYL